MTQRAIIKRKGVVNAVVGEWGGALELCGCSEGCRGPSDNTGKLGVHTHVTARHVTRHWAEQGCDAKMNCGPAMRCMCADGISEGRGGGVLVLQEDTANSCEFFFDVLCPHVADARVCGHRDEMRLEEVRWADFFCFVLG